MQKSASLFSLTSMQFERSNMRMVEMHLQGLKRMVNLRGGLDSIRSESPLLANMIFGYSFLQCNFAAKLLTEFRISMTIMTEPQFSPTENTEYPLTIDPEDEKLKHIMSLETLEALDIAKPHARILRDMNFLCYSLMLTWPIDPTPDYCTDYMNRLVQLPTPIDDGPLVACVSDASRVATTMLCYMPFMDDYPNPALSMFKPPIEKSFSLQEL